MKKYKYIYQIDGDNLGNYHRRAYKVFDTIAEAKNYIRFNGYFCYDYDDYYNDYNSTIRAYLNGFGACIIRKKRVYI